MNIIALKRPESTGQYLNIKRRNYGYQDVFHPIYGFLCRLISMPQGFCVSNASTPCRKLAGTFHQTPVAFERAYLRGAK
jgi:hypothetical protein